MIELGDKMYYTTEETARELNITEAAVRTLVKRKKLHVTKFPPDADPRGAVSLFDPDEVAQIKRERLEKLERAKRGDRDQGALPKPPKEQ